MPETRTFRKASITDVARLAGVSKTTVSYFVSGREDICAPATAERIRAAVASLQYTPSPLARGTRNATRTIGVCLYSPLDPEVRFGNAYFEGLWRGIVEEADNADYGLLHYPRAVRNGTDGSAFLDGRVDGVLIHGQDNLRASLVAGAGMPIVLLSRSRRIPEGCGAVFADQTQVVEQAIDYLRSLGHRRIAHLAGPLGVRPGAPVVEEGADDNALDRYEAFITRMHRDHEGVLDPALIRFADAWDDPTGQNSAAAVAAWRGLPDPPTAVFCANDSLALSLIAAARDAGWRVPADVSIVGVDNSPAAQDSTPSLTSVPVPIADVGRAAMRLLIRRMNGEESGTANLTESARVRVPVPDVVIRASTARITDAASRRTP